MLDILRLRGGWDVAGFLDDDPRLHGRRLAGIEILGGTTLLDELRIAGVTHAAFAVGGNRAREQLLTRAAAAGLIPVNAVHPAATVAADAELGVGIWMAAGTVVNPGSRLGDGVVVNTGATVDHDCRIDAYANISPGCHLSGRTTVGRFAFLGTGAVTIPDVTIGDDAIVGAGAVVIRDVPAGLTVVGVPARPLDRTR